MYNEKLVEDSLKFCQEIEYYKKYQSTDELFEALYSTGKESNHGTLDKIIQNSENVLDKNNSQAETNKNSACDEDSEQEICEKPLMKKVVFRILNASCIFLFCIVAAYLLSSFITGHIIHQATVEGDSMNPTLKNQDVVMMQMLTYHFQDPKRFDIIVFPVENTAKKESSEEDYFVKRVIGLPGETVQIKDGRVYINGNRLSDDPYASLKIQDSGQAASSICLKEGQYFVLGDNRNRSTDSRSSYVGMITKDKIIGKVIGRIKNG